MNEISGRDPLFTEVTRGLDRVARMFPGGRVEDGRIVFRTGRVRLLREPRFEGGDGYRFGREGKDRVVQAWTPFGFISGLVNLTYYVYHDWQHHDEVKPRFKSRLYGFEANLGGGCHRHDPVAHTDEAFWVGYCKSLASRHFNGLVFYSNPHPFESFLDYGEYADISAQTREWRARTLKALKTACGVARDYGVKTFLHHSATHVPPALAVRHNLTAANRVRAPFFAGVDHPAIEEYTRYAYRRTFELLPELTGLYVGFDSTPNAADFVRRCLYPEAARALRTPEIIFDLWRFTSIPEMVDLVRGYPGTVRLAHSIMDHSRAYYWPAADRRIRDWKNALPDTEFIYTLGPCDEACIVESREIWSDPEFIAATLADAQRKGADSISFRSLHELMDDIEHDRISGPRQASHRNLKRGHLDAVVEYVRRGRVIGGDHVSRLGRRLDVDPQEAKRVYDVLREASRITPLMFQQFMVTGVPEGRLASERSSFYADPFLWPPMTDVNRQRQLPPDLGATWLNTEARSAGVPNDVQSPMDYADTGKPRVPRDPFTMARLMRAHAEKAIVLTRKATGEQPRGTMQTLLDRMTVKYYWGMRAYHETRCACFLCEALFARTKPSTLKSLRSGVAELKSTLACVTGRYPATASEIWPMEPASTGRDLKSLKGLVDRLQAGRFPWNAFAAYARSLREYVEIRRAVRPSRVVGARETRLIKRQLDRSIEAGREASDALAGAKHAKLKANVGAWLGYLLAERQGMVPPKLEVPAEGARARDAGWVQLWHDQCFRHGENLIADLAAFFAPTDFLRRDELFMRATVGYAGMVLSLKQTNIHVPEIVDFWTSIRGTVEDTYALRFFVNRKCDGVRTETFSICSEGRSCLKEAVEIHGPQHSKTELARVVPGGSGHFESARGWWRLDYTIPWDELGGRPEPGDEWKVNVTANPTGARNRQSAWCQGYEFLAGKTSRMGTFVFV